MLTQITSNQSLLSEDVWLEHGNVHIAKKMTTELFSFGWSWKLDIF